MIKDLSKAVKALIDSLSNKPVATMTAIFIIFASYVGVKSYNTIQSLVVTPDEEAARFEAQLHNTDIINKSIEDLRAATKADNIIIRQFHNGRHDLTGIPFTSISTTFYADPIDEHEPFVDEPISAMNKSLRQVWQRIDSPECIVLYSPVDASTRRYFKAHNLNRAVVCPLVNLLNYPIGIMVVGLSEESSTVSDIEVQTKTSVLAKQAAGYLNAGY
jgi:hypothetical protein